MFSQLVRHFFHRFLDNDLIAPQGEMHATFSQVLGLVAAPGLLVPLFLLVKYTSPFRNPMAREVASWSDKLFFLAFAMVVMGALTVLEWDALFPDRRDYSVLVALPLSTASIFAAKLVSLVVFAVVFSVDINLGSSAVFPMCMLAGEPASLARYAQYATAHAAATFSACAFVFLSFVALQGLLLNALSYRWFRRVSLYVQFAALFVVVLVLLLIPDLMMRVWLWKRQNSPLLYLFPPCWFLGLYETLAGWSDPVFRSLAALAVRALGVAAAVSLATYILAYKRHVKRSLEAPNEVRTGAHRLGTALARRMNRIFLRDPAERASFYFIGKTLLRSRGHRLILAAYVGAGFAFVLQVLVPLFSKPGQVFAGRPTPALLSVQLLLTFFILSGMRFVFTIPAELPANWGFRLAEGGRMRECLSGVRKAMLAFAVVPLFAVFLPMHTVLWGWRTAFVHSVFGALMAGTLMEVLLLNFQKVPFTCSYLPGKANVKVLWPVYWYGFWFYAYRMARLEYDLLDRPVKLAIVFALVLAAWYALIRARERFFRTAGASFVYEEFPEPVVRTLNLGH